MTLDLWLMLAAALGGGAIALLFACLQVAGAASDAADRALARGLLLGLQVPLRYRARTFGDRFRGDDR